MFFSSSYGMADYGKILPTVSNGQNFYTRQYNQAVASPVTFSRNSRDTHHSPAMPTTV